MEIDRKSIKALSSDTRVTILKSLGSRRKMPSELARELSLAPSTVVGHLKILERSKLVHKVETGHKWKYYELTQKGRNLVKPKLPVQFVVMLSLGILMIFGSLGTFLSAGIAPLRSATLDTMEAGEALAGEVPQATSIAAPIWEQTELILFLIMIAGIVLITIAAVKLWSRRK